jgi:DNA-binding HxlR family transcriptional regulator
MTDAADTTDAAGAPDATDAADAADTTDATDATDAATEAADATNPPDPPELSAGLSREQAAALRESFDAAEQERIQRTVADLLDLLGKTHTMAVLSAFAFATGPLRFSDLEADLGIPPNTLSTRLRDLTEAGLLERDAYDEVPPRVEYTPTEKAESLFPVFAHLHHWAIEHDLQGGP